jgi:fibronectin-binding autotransporter adhesin
MEDGAASNGGGINASSASITFTNDSITGNKSTGNGGGIYQTGGTLAINNSVLSENTVSGNGGDLSVQNADVTIENAVIETGTASQDGGGIDQTDGTLTISNNTAVNQNNATSGAGMFLTDCTFSMTDGQLDTNKASESGGAADVSGSSSTTFVLSSVTVSYNTITDSSGTGAGILAIDVPLLIGDCTFTKDVATGNGGAILATGSSTLQINGGSISGNQASDGAGIFMQKSNSKEPSAFISDVTISNNTASQSGGGIYAATIAEFSIVSAVLKSNTASMSSGSGGGIFLSGGSLLVAGTTITSNQAFQGGGAYFNNGVATLKEDSVVKSNTAVADGGGLFSSNSTLDLNDAAISHNSANTTLETPSYGGGVYQAGGGSLDVSNHAKVTHNAASYGGGILCNNAAFILNSSVIEANTATIEGAGLCSTTNSKAMSITNGTISGNAIDAIGAASGAGLFLSGSGALNTKGT